MTQIAEVLLDLLASLEGDGQGALHEDDVVRILEEALYQISRLDAESKFDLCEAARRMAGETASPQRREFFLDAPRIFRLDAD